MQSIIKETHLLQKPSLNITFSTKLHSILSYALLILSFIDINTFFPSVSISMHELTPSYATKVLSVINLHGTKAPWFYEITLGETCLRQLARTLEINSYTTLPRLIGRELVILMLFLIFGMRTIYMWLISFYMEHEKQIKQHQKHFSQLCANISEKIKGAYHLDLALL